MKVDERTALKVAVVTLISHYEEEFIDKFGIDKLMECGKDTEHLAAQNVNVEDVLYEALYGDK